MKKSLTLNTGLLLMMLSILSIASCNVGASSLDDDENYHSDMVAKGWQLVNKWDFFNSIEGWKHEQVTGNNKGGYVRVEDGILEFGYSQNGGTVYMPNTTRPIPFTSYMLIARVKTDNPFGALVGFFSPSSKNLAGASRIRNTGWQIVKTVYSFNPTTGAKPPQNMFPGIQNLTKNDYTYVDWVEFWIYPKNK